MNILVCISKTPETTAKIAFTEENTKYDTSGVNFIMNPYDEWYALVRALELVEKNGGEVTVINVGPKDNDTVIRKALAIGAHKAVRIDAQPESALQTAKYIHQYASTQDYDAIFLGKETIDFNGSEVGAMLSGLMDWPFISYASKLEVEGDKHIINRDIEGGVEKVEVEGKYILSAAKGLAEQRIPNMRGIMMAKRKPLDVVEAQSKPDLNVSVETFSLPPAKTEVKLVDPENMEELVKLLHEEAKVI